MQKMYFDDAMTAHMVDVFFSPETQIVLNHTHTHAHVTYLFNVMNFLDQINRLNRFIFIAIIVISIFFYFSTDTFTYSRKKTPLRPAEIENHSSLSFAGFYHFSTMNTPWRSIVYEQMFLAHHSGLLDASINVYVTGLGNITQNQSISHAFSNSKFIYEYKSDILLYEFPTLKKLEKFCLKNHHSLVWYAHSKGASYSCDTVSNWRHVMNYFVLDNWHLCYRLLSSTNYTTCGSALAFYSTNPIGRNIFYAGNMWWAKCSHVNQLDRLDKFDQSNRYEAESYVTSIPNMVYFNCFSPGLNLSDVSWALDRKTANCSINQPLWTVH